MIFDIITIFPGFFRSIVEHGVLKRGLAGGQIEIRVHDLRDFTHDLHRTVDDRPFGGGPGMVLKPEPLFEAVEAIRSEPWRGLTEAGAVPAGGREPEASFPAILLSPQGRLLRQPVVEELAQQPRLLLMCGRYEGVDQRVAECLATDELSIGDYVLSGGELAAAVVMESCTRLLPGVMGNEESGQHESFGSAVTPASLPEPAGGVRPIEAAVAARLRRQPELLDFPNYTRPADFRGMRVPEVLFSGNHEQIRKWRRRQSLERTWRRRPELLLDYPLGEEDRRMLDEIQQAAELAR